MACLFVVDRAPAEELIVAESLSGNSSAGTMAPELVSLIHLNAQISASRDPKQRQSLDLQRHQILQQLTRRILSSNASELATGPSADTLRRLRDATATRQRKCRRSSSSTPQC